MEWSIIVYGQGAQELAVAGLLLAERLGELMVRKGVLTKDEAAAVVAAARADATAQPTISGQNAGKIIDAVGEAWAKAK